MDTVDGKSWMAHFAAGRPSKLSDNDSWPARCQVATVSLVLASLWVYQVARFSAAGFWRMLLIMPAVAIQFAVPFLFNPETEFLTTVTVAFVSWRTASSKVLAFAFDRGPLAGQLSALQFVAVTILPVLPAKGEKLRTAADAADAGQPAVKECWHELRVTIGSILALQMLPSVGAYMPEWLAWFIRTSMLGLLQYGLLGMATHSAELFCILVCHLPCEHSFQRPYLATSVTDFWARRWNVQQSAIIRALIYEPLYSNRQMAAVVKDPKARRLLCTEAAFIWSGLEHELFYWFILRRTTGGLTWLAYFAIQTPLLGLEQVAKHVARLLGLRFPRAISNLVTFVVLSYISGLLFIPPLDDEQLYVWGQASMLSGREKLVGMCDAVAENLPTAVMKLGWLCQLGAQQVKV